jgi:serine/threonine protein kinase
MVKTRKSHKKQLTHKRNNKRNKGNHKTNKHKIYKKKGGKVIASGGYGCVFDPSLQCQETGLREQGKISKLMMNKYAVEELNIINNLRDKLSTIPNYRDYFLVDGATLCKPSPLTENDLGDFDEKCTALTKRKASKMTVNRADVLGALTILNLPNGGLDLDDFFKSAPSYQNIYKIQVALLQLLKNGIIPMNAKNIYHNDIKASNLLVDTTNNTFKIRLIDWGFVTEYVPSDEIPRIWKSRPFAFNEPFSLVLFSDKFYNEYTIFNLDYTTPSAFDNNIDYFLDSYVKHYEHTGGHYRYIMDIFYVLYQNNLPNTLTTRDKKVQIENRYAIPIIKNYLKQIIIKFTKNGPINNGASSSSSLGVSGNSANTINSALNASPNNSPFASINSEDLFFNATERSAIEDNTKRGLKIYLDSVFIKNVDIWGFVMSYIPILKFLSEKYGLLNKSQKQLFESLKFLFITYLFFDPNEPILEKTDFFETLNNITFFLQEIITVKPVVMVPSTNSFQEYSSETES